MNEYVESFLNFEKNYKKDDLINWSSNHVELPIFASAIYLVMVFYAPSLIKKPFSLKRPLAVWNLILAVFSIMGASRTVPVFIKSLRIGFGYSICGDVSYLDGPSGLWMALFIYSKFFELIDTLFLIIHKRPVIFLHWFHHLTVLLYVDGKDFSPFLPI